MAGLFVPVKDTHYPPSRTKTLYQTCCCYLTLPAADRRLLHTYQSETISFTVERKMGLESYYATSDARWASTCREPRSSQQPALKQQLAKLALIEASHTRVSAEVMSAVSPLQTEATLTERAVVPVGNCMQVYTASFSVCHPWVRATSLRRTGMSVSCFMDGKATLLQRGLSHFAVSGAHADPYPAGTMISYHSSDSASHILPARLGQQQRVRSLPHLLYGPLWSQDGPATCRI